MGSRHQNIRALRKKTDFSAVSSVNANNTFPNFPTDYPDYSYIFHTSLCHPDVSLPIGPDAVPDLAEMQTTIAHHKLHNRTLLLVLRVLQNKDLEDAKAKWIP